MSIRLIHRLSLVLGLFRSPEPIVVHEIVADEDDPIEDLAGVAAPARAPAVPRPVGSPYLDGGWLQKGPARGPAAPEVANVWARRALGAPDPSRLRGVCSGCGTQLSVARAPRPVRVACPVCGRTRTIA